MARGSKRKPQRNTLNPDPWTRLIGRANEEKIMVNGKSVTAVLNTGSQVTHISQTTVILWVSPYTPSLN